MEQPPAKAGSAPGAEAQPAARPSGLTEELTKELTEGLTEGLIDKLRSIGLRLDHAGTFWHEGSPVTHPRLRQALLRWLDVRADGRDIVRLDDRRYAYVDIEDAHLRARAARWRGDRCFVLWDDDREAELDYGSLRQAADHALYARVHDQLRGRIAGPAYHAIAERIVETTGEAPGETTGEATGPDGFVLEAAGRRWPIANAA